MNNTFLDSEKFYIDKVAPMIKEYFSDYENRIAVGLVGEGSDCFGYDDFMSRDHDFGTGVCLWLDDEDCYKIGKQLSDKYDDIAYGQGYRGLSSRLRERRGVMSIHDFYSNILCIDCDIDNINMPLNKWRVLDYTCLATATNGIVFRDDLGKFSAFRKLLLDYYPEQVWKERLVDEIHKFSMSLQVNYARCMSRKDYVTAKTCKQKGIEAAMEIYFLLRRVYPPYYKWTYKALKQLDNEGSFSNLINDISDRDINKNAWFKEYNPNIINVEDEVILLAEQIASYLLIMMKDNKLVNGQDLFLERYINQIME